MARARERFKAFVEKDIFLDVAMVSGALVGAGLGTLVAWLSGVSFIWLLVIMCGVATLGAILAIRAAWVIQEKFEED